MKTQPETTLIAKPFKLMLKDRGWWISRVHSDGITDCLPDCHACHPKFGERWIEFKVRSKYNTIKLSPDQTDIFPHLISHGCKIWCIAAFTLLGEENKLLRERLYSKLFEKPNGEYMLVKSLHKLLF